MKIIKKQDLLPILRPLLPDNPIIIEAGAFDGKDTITLATFWPQGTIHAFEPVPEIFSLLQKRTQNFSNIVRHAYALSDANGTASFYVSEKPSRPGKPFQAGSLLQPKERLQYSDAQYPQAITVPTITLKKWATEQDIDHVDFIWLDVQGMALPILQAAGPLLKTIKALWIEVEFIEAYAGQSTYHALDAWLKNQRFIPIAKDFENETQWFFGNVLYVNETLDNF